MPSDTVYVGQDFLLRQGLKNQTTAMFHAVEISHAGNAAGKRAAISIFLSLFNFGIIATLQQMYCRCREKARHCNALPVERMGQLSMLRGGEISPSGGNGRNRRNQPVTNSEKFAAADW